MQQSVSNNRYLSYLQLFLLFAFSLCLVLAPFMLFASNSRSLSALNTKIEGRAFEATLKEGFHFNEKAPNGIQVNSQLIKPTEFSARVLKFTSLPENASGGTAHLYVCDDKVTFCDRHLIPLGRTFEVSKKEPTRPPPKAAQVSHGFLVNDFEAGLQKAQKSQKLFLVDFGARWCPACLRLEEEILKSPAFQKATRDFVKVKMDVDLFTTQVLETKYGIKGVPTLLFLTPEGKEITRFYDYQPLSFVQDVISEVRKNPQDIETLEKAAPSEDLKKILIKRYFFSDQHGKALVLMEKMSPEPKEYWFSKVSEAESLMKKDPSRKKNLVKVLKSAIEADPSGSRSLLWRLSLVQNLENEKEKKKVAEESFQLTRSLLSDDKALAKSLETDFLGEYTGLEGFYVAMMNAEVADSAGYETKVAWKLVIEQGEKYKVDAKKTGASLRLLSALIRDENYDRALVLVNAMLKRTPRDGDLQRRKMRVLFGLKQYQDAIDSGEKALKDSYGANEFFVLETLVKSYIAANKREKAQDLLQKYLSRNEIQFEEMKSLKAKLEAFQQELSIQE